MQKLMRAVELQAPGILRCVEKEIPGLEKPKDVIVRVKACGVCGSDIPRTMVKGAHVMPIVIGHEFAGEVIEIGDEVQTVKPGDRVTVMPLIPCGSCDYCRIGEYTLCDDYLYYGSRMPGAMAEYIRVDAENILILPDKVDYQMGAMTDPASVALHAVRKASVEPGQTAVVFGLGAIGFITLQWLKAVGCTTVFAVDIFEEKLDLARELGADATFNGKTEDVVKTILAETGGKGMDIAIEQAGNKITQVQAIQSVGKMGTVIMCGISYDDLVLPNQAVNAILRNELVIKGSWNSSIAPLPINEWESALAFMDNGKISVKPLISHRVKLEDCQSVFEMMFHQKEVFTKVLFEPEW